MTPDDLVERVARAIDESLNNARITKNNLFYEPEARVAIRIALEEAVPVAARIMRDSIAAWLEGNGFAEAVPFVRSLPLTQAEAPPIRAMIKD